MDREMVIQKIQQIIREQGTQRAAAEFLGVSEQYFGDVLKGRRMPGAKILDKLGLESRVIYTPKEQEIVK